jgi:hypothetical protein
MYISATVREPNVAAQQTRDGNNPKSKRSRVACVKIFRNMRIKPSSVDLPNSTLETTTLFPGRIQSHDPYI